MDAERRNSSRKRCLLGARVVLNGGASTLSCVMRNHSEHGALLAFTEPQALPERFELIVEKHGAAAAAQGVWRQGSRIGVAFAGAGAMDAMERCAADRETARLRRTRAAEVSAADAGGL